MRPGPCLVVIAITLLSACAEKVQTIDSGRQADAHAFEGAAPAFTAGGWKSGDAASWERQMKNRAQGQNEYSRIAP